MSTGFVPPTKGPGRTRKFTASEEDQICRWYGLDGLTAQETADRVALLFKKSVSASGVRCIAMRRRQQTDGAA